MIVRAEAAREHPFDASTSATLQLRGPSYQGN